jgi:hypothetical protein
VRFVEFPLRTFLDGEIECPEIIWKIAKPSPSQRSMLSNKVSLGTHLTLALRCVFGLLMAMGIASAFPPAPYYTLFGVVRDRVGQTVTAEGAEVILLKGGTASYAASAPLAFEEF